ncbi:uncharacterized protein AB7M35_000299 [Amorphus suaedae]
MTEPGDGDAAPRGIVLKEAHYPGRAPVDAYGNGGFRFAEMSHKGSILCVPSGIYAWAPEAPGEIDAAALERVVAEAEGIELLLLGMGTLPMPLAASLKDMLREAGIRFEVMATGPAVRTFNVLLGESRPVAAGFIVVA